MAVHLFLCAAYVALLLRYGVGSNYYYLIGSNYYLRFYILLLLFTIVHRCRFQKLLYVFASCVCVFVVGFLLSAEVTFLVGGEVVC